MFNDDLDKDIRTESSTPELNLLLVSKNKINRKRIEIDLFDFKG